MKTILQSVLLLAVMAHGGGPAQDSITGEWLVTVHDPFGVYWTRLVLAASGGDLTGAFSGTPLTGRLEGDRFEFKAGNAILKGRITANGLSGEATFNRAMGWTAVRIPTRPAVPRTHDFEPKTFALYFSAATEPVLRIHAGDSVRTSTLDAGGRDKAGTRLAGTGNPQTGPFYVEEAMPGDTLVVRLIRVRTNRDWATSGNMIVRNALEDGNIEWTPDFPNRWTLDGSRNVAVLDKATDALKGFTVALQPMLGCIATAPERNASVRTFESGRFGGNMDYNRMREGTTVYLPVSHPGALLFIGDGHAAQGDGELTGDALETSMDVEFAVDVIRGASYGHPIAENDEFVISIGIDGSLDQALQQATSGLLRWLQSTYKITTSEGAMILGFAVQYDVVDLVRPNVSVAARLPKSKLAQLTKKSR